MLLIELSGGGATEEVVIVHCSSEQEAAEVRAREGVWRLMTVQVGSVN